MCLEKTGGKSGFIPIPPGGRGVQVGGGDTSALGAAPSDNGAQASSPPRHQGLYIARHSSGNSGSSVIPTDT